MESALNVEEGQQISGDGLEQAEKAVNETKAPGLPAGAEYRQGILLYRGCPVDQMMAYPLRIACRVLGISYTVLWEEIKLRKIRMTDRKLISRKEIERYLSEQSKDEN